MAYFLYNLSFSQKLSELPISSDVKQSSPLVTIASTEKRSVLTPTTPTTTLPTTATKKFKPTELNQIISSTTKQEQMPEYLSHTKKIIETIITPLLPQYTTIDATVLIEELREMAFLEHQLQRINLDISLWKIYLQSGTGQLKDTEEHEGGEEENDDDGQDHRSLLAQLQYPQPVRPCVWPKKLKTIIMNDSSFYSEQNTILNHATYLNYVNKTLTEFQQQSLAYQTQIQEKRHYLNTNLTPEIEQTIANLVEDYGTALYRIVIKGYIAAVQFSYKDRLVELEFEREDSSREYVNNF